MTEQTPSQLHLHRIDPSRNMRRFYMLTIQPTLFGDVSLLRHWGRIGTNGQSMMQTFADPEAARAAFHRLERIKRNRGYGRGHAQGDAK
ncbi:WGR domain-containing protein [Tianweitania sp. BSSL-BM11]|uniref:WGR domain-containing protein n=1 Tax=Tianweitania aestuarii TaxID=2814886 RepID=A0ABS5RYK1_9HYPH|nr:WGR domain-containing protein [Tianweitania aestuarii]MBS9722130.1 WGR domain-containing protein [Tianweitania aestuarii]